MIPDTTVGADGLIAPIAYFALTLEQHRAICNGAGPAGYGWVIPDTIYGLSITPAANIHDYCYHVRANKAWADRTFYENMLVLIRKRGGWLRHLRGARAWVYYRAVVGLGSAAYKNT